MISTPEAAYRHDSKTRLIDSITPKDSRTATVRLPGRCREDDSRASDDRLYIVSRYAVAGRRRCSSQVIAHPTPARTSTGRLADSTNRTVSSTEARLALAVLTTDRKAA